MREKRIILNPVNGGINCPANGEHIGDDGRLIECRCDECDFLICCLEGHTENDCENCTAETCPNAKIVIKEMTF